MELTSKLAYYSDQMASFAGTKNVIRFTSAQTAVRVLRSFCDERRAEFEQHRLEHTRLSEQRASTPHS